MFKLTFDTGNAAFDGDELYMEAGRIIGQVGDAVADGRTQGKVRDVNGNTVGEWTLTRADA